MNDATQPNTLRDKIKAQWAEIDGAMPRLWKTSLLTVIALIVLAWFALHMLGVVFNKAVLIGVAAVLGYYIDRATNRTSRPHEIAEAIEAIRQTAAETDDGGLHAYCHARMASLEQRLSAAESRRAIIVAAAIIGIALGA